MGDGDGLPGPDRRLDHPGRARPGDQPHPARHAGHARPRSGCPARSRSRVAQVDAMSGGRVELGLGAGWFEREHTAYGIPFPPAGRALRPARGAAGDRHRPVDARPWASASPTTGGTTSWSTRPALPKPVQQPTPDHRRRRRRQAHARRWRPGSPTSSTCPFASVGRDRARSSSGSGPPARPTGRDPADDPVSAAHTVCCGARRRRGGRRAAAIGRDPADLREPTRVAGTPDEVVARLGSLRRRSAPAASTSRCSTSTTSTTWTCSRPRWPLSCPSDLQLWPRLSCPRVVATHHCFFHAQLRRSIVGPHGKPSYL